MLNKESYVTRSSNSHWSLLKIFHIYNSGHHRKGHASFIFVGAIKKRRYINPNKRRHQIAHKAFGCITSTVGYNYWLDGQYMRTSHNKAATITQRIRRSRLKVKGLLFLATRRHKYLKHSKSLI